MTELLEMGRAALARQPFSVLLQAELVSYTAGVAELKIPITEQIKQQHGFVHGGVVSYLADNALTYAGACAMGGAVVTAEFKINYIRPAIGTSLVARASALHAGKTQAVCRCDVFAISAEGELLCAAAQGTIARLSRSGE
jgi:uncharacterized protein (TIGR00369 family)